jgi:hypothetical protein
MSCAPKWGQQEKERERDISIFIYQLVSLYNNFYNKTNITVPTFVFYMRVLLYCYTFRPFYWVYLRRVQYRQ